MRRALRVEKFYPIWLNQGLLNTRPVVIQNVCCFLGSIFILYIGFNNTIVHIILFRKTNCFSSQSFQMSPKIPVPSFNVRRFLFLDNVLFLGYILLVRFPTICTVSFNLQMA